MKNQLSNFKLSRGYSFWKLDKPEMWVIFDAMQF